MNGVDLLRNAQERVAIGKKAIQDAARFSGTPNGSWLPRFPQIHPTETAKTWNFTR